MSPESLVGTWEKAGLVFVFSFGLDEYENLPSASHLPGSWGIPY